MANTNSLDFERSSTQYGTAATTGDDAFASSSYTIEAWIKVESLATGEASHVLTKFEDPSKKQWVFGVGSDPGNKVIYCEHYDNAGTLYQIFSDDSTLTIGAWTHIAVVNSAGTFTLYKNGVAITTNVSGTYGAQGDKDVPVQIARRTVGASPGYFDGLIDEVRFWNTARTGPQILANYQTELVGNETGLIGYWKLNDGTGTTALDETANNFDITLTNTPVWTTDVPFTGLAVSSSDQYGYGDF